MDIDQKTEEQFQTIVASIAQFQAEYLKTHKKYWASVVATHKEIPAHSKSAAPDQLDVQSKLTDLTWRQTGVISEDPLPFSLTVQEYTTNEVPGWWCIAFTNIDAPVSTGTPTGTKVVCRRSCGYGPESEKQNQTWK